MNRAIPQEIVDEIRARSNIVDIIGSIVQLKRAGSGVYKALCPFHQEKTPSFTVNENKQVYHCFGCGKGGDVFRFIMEHENVDFPNAIHLLAARCGVIIPENTDPAERARSAERADARKRLYELNEAFASFFERKLKEDPNSPAALYLRQRGIPEEVRAKFRIGFSPDEWTAAANYGRSLGYTDNELETSGVVRRNESSGRLYDHFKGRLTFAIWNESGKVVGFSARTLESDAKVAKYVNTPETPVFKKGQLLYALPFARPEMADNRQGMAILCEGQLDTIAMHRAGFPCAVAPQGTGFTEEQAAILKRATDKVLLAFDSDGAGQKAILRGIELLLPLKVEIRVIHFPGGKDPDELFRKNGPEAIRSAVEQAEDWLDFLLQKYRNDFDCTTPMGKSKAAAELCRLLALISDAVTRELYLRSAAEKLGISENALLAELAAMNRREFRRLNGTPVAPASPPQEKQDRTELAILELALNDESAARELLEVWPPDSPGVSLTHRAINAVLGAVLNGEFSSAGSAVGELLRENPCPEISRLLVSECSYPPDKIAKALQDCLKTLASHRRDERRKELLSQMRSAAPEDKAKLLSEIVALSKE